MKDWAVYLDSGRIDRIYSGPETQAQFQPTENENIIELLEGYDDVNSYVIDNVMVLKAEMGASATSQQITANGTDEAIISSIPAGVQVRWPDGQTDIVTDGEIRFSVDLPGTYTFRFTAVPYLDQEVVIEAIAAT